MISGKKLSGIKVPDIKLTIEFFIKFAPQRFFKMNAEKPKHKLKAYQNQATPKGAELFTCLKNTRCKSLKADDKMFNKIISKIRVRIEHVFGFVENSMHGSSLRSIRFDRAVLNTDLTNLAYNLLRYEQVKRLNLKTWR
jgi:hypothetical protein